MTPEAQRIAIAEACGWKPTMPFINVQGETVNDWIRNLHEVCHGIHGLPDYLNDLNAMHEAEKVLLGKVGWVHYSQVLLKGDVHASAARRAEAFLRTLGLWKEDEVPSLQETVK